MAALSGVQKRDFIQAIVDKAILSNKQLIIYLDVSPNSVRPFITDVYINQSSSPMEFITNEYTVTITTPIVFRRYTNTKFSKAKASLLTITENNNLIVKAFATAWKYKELYEQGMGPDNIRKQERISPRTLFNYLSLAYMNPNKINAILSGKSKLNITEIFNTAFANQL